MTLSYERLSEIKKRLAAATPGPWEQPAYPSGTMVYCLAERDHIADCEWSTDADFIAHAPEDLALLLKVIETAIHSHDFALDDHGYLRKRHWSDDV